MHRNGWALGLRAGSAAFGLVLAGLGPVGLSTSAAHGQAYSQFNVKLPMVQRSVLPGIEGRLDHVGFDPVTGCTYYAALRAGSLEVMDPGAMKVLQSVKELSEPQGVLVLPEQRKLAVSCGDGTVQLFSIGQTGTLTKDRAVQFSGEADAIRYDEAAKRVYVVAGKSLHSFDPATGEKAAVVELPSVPEGFVLERGGQRIFVNLPKSGEVAVVDREKKSIVATWTLKDVKGNYAMAYDPEAKRLFVAGRSPAKLVVLNTDDGKEITRLDLGEDCDDLWYDKAGERIYASCGGGSGEVTMIRRTAPDVYTVEHREKTTTGSRTSLLVPERRKLYVVAPKSGDTPTFVFIYLLPP